MRPVLQQRTDNVPALIFQLVPMLLQWPQLVDPAELLAFSQPLKFE